MYIFKKSILVHFLLSVSISMNKLRKIPYVMLKLLLYTFVLNKSYIVQGRRHWGVGGHGSPTFLCSKKEKGKQRQARKTFKAETIKRLSLRSKLYCLSHSRASRIKKFFFSANHGGRQYFSVFHGPCILKSISLAL